VTEPREPEAVPEGESASVEQPAASASPSTGTWYPVAAPAEPGPAAVDDTVPPSVEPEVAAPDPKPDADVDATEPVRTAPQAAPEAEEDGPANVDAEATDPTVALTGTGFPGPVADAAEPTPSFTPPTEAIFRPPSPSSPGYEPTTMEPLSLEEQKLAAERAARRDARAAALAAPAPEPVAAPAPVVIHKRTNDKFWGSLSIFLLRIVLAGIFAIRGLGILTDIPAAEAEFAKTVLLDYPPGPQVTAIVTGVGSLLIALSLLLGLLTRVAGLGIALIAGGALALVYWGPWSLFMPGQAGFLGEYELLLAAVGILLLCIGGGGWSLDRSFRAGRERDKRERAAESA